jgi:hypothetical protein
MWRVACTLRGMAIRFTFDGDEYTCDTPKEVAELRKLLGRRRPQRRPKSNATSGLKPVQPPLASLRESGVRPSSLTTNLLRTLLESVTGLESDALAHKLGIKSKSLPPIMGHLNALLENAGYESKNLIERRTTYDKGRAKSNYSLTSLGREVVPRLLQSAA